MTREFEKKLIEELKKVVSEIQDLKEGFVEASVKRAVNRLRRKSNESLYVDGEKVTGKKLIVATKLTEVDNVMYKEHEKCVKYDMLALVMMISEDSYKWIIEKCDYYWDSNPESELEEFVNSKYSFADMDDVPEELTVVL